jgi:hypothetical protein
VDAAVVLIEGGRVGVLGIGGLGGMGLFRGTIEGGDLDDDNDGVEEGIDKECSLEKECALEVGYSSEE